MSLPSPAEDTVVGRRAGQHVVEARALYALEVGQRVVLIVRLRRQVDLHGTGGVGIIDPVRSTIATIERIGTSAAEYAVVTGTADDVVGIGVAGKRIVEGGPRDVFEAGQDVGLVVAVIGLRQVERDRGCGIGIVDPVAIARATAQRIGTTTAADRIVAVTARDRVVAAGTGQNIIVVGADGVFETGDRACQAGRAGGEIERDPGGCVGIVDRIVAALPVQHVGAALAAADGIVAIATQDRVVAAVSDERIAARRNRSGFPHR